MSKPRVKLRNLNPTEKLGNIRAIQTAPPGSTVHGVLEHLAYFVSNGNRDNPQKYWFDAQHLLIAHVNGDYPTNTDLHVRLIHADELEQTIRDRAYFLFDERRRQFELHQNEDVGTDRLKNPLREPLQDWVTAIDQYAFNLWRIQVHHMDENRVI